MSRRPREPKRAAVAGVVAAGALVGPQAYRMLRDKTDDWAKVVLDPAR
jgi:hypothetical protein